MRLVTKLGVTRPQARVQRQIECRDLWLRGKEPSRATPKDFSYLETTSTFSLDA